MKFSTFSLTFFRCQAAATITESEKSSFLSFISNGNYVTDLMETIVKLFVFFQMLCFYIGTIHFNRTRYENINIAAVTLLR